MVALPKLLSGTLPKQFFVRPNVDYDFSGKGIDRERANAPQVADDTSRRDYLPEAAFGK